MLFINGLTAGHIKQSLRHRLNEVEERINAGRLRREEIFESKRARQKKREKEKAKKRASRKRYEAIQEEGGFVSHARLTRSVSMPGAKNSLLVHVAVQRANERQAKIEDDDPDESARLAKLQRRRAVVFSEGEEADLKEKEAKDVVAKQVSASAVAEVVAAAILGLARMLPPSLESSKRSSIATVWASDDAE